MGRRIGTLVTVALAIGCGPDPRQTAERQLASEGYLDVVLTEVASGGFDFEATRDGVPCRGSVGISSSWGSSEVMVGGVCGWPTEGEPLVAACESHLETGPCEEASLALFEGSSGLAADPARAVALAVRACDAGRPESCRNAAIGYRDGRGVDADPARALALFTRACDGGHAPGCYEAGRAHENGRGTTRDLSTAETFLRRGCDADEPLSCSELGFLLIEVGDRDPEARGVLERACERGSDDGCRNLGVLLHTGRGGPADEPRAETLWQTGCDAGDGLACGSLGSAIRRAGGDGARVLELFTRACDLGDGTGCQDAGRFLGAEGPAQDLERARRFFDLGCQHEDALSCRNLAVWLRDGTGGPPAPERVTELLRRACTLGDEPACAELRRTGEDAALP